MESSRLKASGKYLCVRVASAFTLTLIDEAHRKANDTNCTSAGGLGGTLKGTPSLRVCYLQYILYIM